jgi:hypothetical protein
MKIKSKINLALIIILNLYSLIDLLVNEYEEISNNYVTQLIFAFLAIMFSVGIIIDQKGSLKSWIPLSIYYVIYAAASSINIFQESNTWGQNLVIILSPLIILLSLLSENKMFLNFFLKFKTQKIGGSIIFLVLFWIILGIKLTRGFTNSIGNLIFYMSEFSLFYYPISLFLLQVYTWFDSKRKE